MRINVLFFYIFPLKLLFKPTLKLNYILSFHVSIWMIFSPYLLTTAKLLTLLDMFNYTCKSNYIFFIVSVKRIVLKIRLV